MLGPRETDVVCCNLRSAERALCHSSRFYEMRANGVQSHVLKGALVVPGASCFMASQGQARHWLLVL